jgi:hypothetical protein
MLEWIEADLRDWRAGEEDAEATMVSIAKWACRWVAAFDWPTASSPAEEIEEEAPDLGDDPPKPEGAA